MLRVCWRNRIVCRAINVQHKDWNGEVEPHVIGEGPPPSGVLHVFVAWDATVMLTHFTEPGRNELISHIKPVMFTAVHWMHAKHGT